MGTRKNDKLNIVKSESIIKKSNAITIAKLNLGLTLNQVQLLAYFIYCTQQDGKTSFHKADFEKRFGLPQYRTEYAKKDVKRLMSLQISTVDNEQDNFAFWNVFTDITYNNGVISFNWHPKFIPHILDLKEKYIINNLEMTSHFKSVYSWLFYEKLKTYYNFFHKIFTKEELLSVFNVEDIKSYREHTGRLKQSVLDIAIKEINEYTELNVHYKEIKEGRKVVAFDIHWSTGKQISAASPKLLEEIQALFEAIELMADDILLMSEGSQMAREKAAENYRAAVSIKSEFTQKKLHTKEEAEHIYRLLKMIFKTINNILESPNRVVFYNWLDDREE